MKKYSEYLYMITLPFHKLLDILNLENQKKRSESVEKNTEQVKYHEYIENFSPATIYHFNYYIFRGDTELDGIIKSQDFILIVDCLRDCLSKSSFDFRYAYFGLIAVLRQSNTFYFLDGRQKAIDELEYSGVIYHVGKYVYHAKMSLNEYFQYITCYDYKKDSYIAIKEQKYKEEYLNEYFFNKEI